MLMQNISIYLNVHKITINYKKQLKKQLINNLSKFKHYFQLKHCIRIKNKETGCFKTFLVYISIYLVYLLIPSQIKCI